MLTNDSNSVGYRSFYTQSFEREHLYDIERKYFPDATVTWSFKKVQRGKQTTAILKNKTVFKTMFEEIKVN